MRAREAAVSSIHQTAPTMPSPFLAGESGSASSPTLARSCVDSPLVVVASPIMKMTWKMSLWLKCSCRPMPACPQARARASEALREERRKSESLSPRSD